MSLTLKKGDFRFGIVWIDENTTGIVVAFSKNIFDVKKNRFKYDDADVSTQWVAKVDSQGKMLEVCLDITWESYREKIIILFDMFNPEHRKMAKQIALDKKINFINVENLNEESCCGISSGIYAEVNKVQILKWLEMEENGEDIRNYREEENE